MSKFLEFEDDIEINSTEKGTWGISDTYSEYPKDKKKELNKYLKKRIGKSQKIQKMEKNIRKLKKIVKKLKSSSQENDIAKLKNCENKEERKKIVKQLLKGKVI